MPETRASLSGLVDARYAELIGDVCVVWNYLEDSVGYILPKYLDHNQDISSPILALLGNQSRIDLLLHFVETKEDNPDLAERIRYFAKAFSICRENRNIIVHSAVRLEEPLTPTHLERASRSKPGAKVRYAYDLKIILRALGEMMDTLTFISYISTAFYLTKIRQLRKVLGEEVDDRATPLPWPDIPPLPRKMTPLPPEDRPSEPPPPLSSAE